MKGLIETASTVLVAVAACALMYTVAFRDGGQSAQAGPPKVADVTGTIAKERLRNVVGTGPIAIIEFSDFQCPYCARHATETMPGLITQLINTGAARYAVVNLPLAMHPEAIPAAEAAECAAEQGKYWQMHGALFEGQQGLATMNYGLVAGAIGVDVGRFDACLAADAALARVQADAKDAERLEVRSTPTLFLGRVQKDGGVDLVRQLRGALPVETFVAEVAKLTHG